nr:hypothetical protein [Tanacetum cinerariifolium]
MTTQRSYVVPESRALPWSSLPTSATLQTPPEITNRLIVSSTITTTTTTTKQPPTTTTAPTSPQEFVTLPSPPRGSKLTMMRSRRIKVGTKTPKYMAVDYYTKVDSSSVTDDNIVDDDSAVLCSARVSGSTLVFSSYLCYSSDSS